MKQRAERIIRKELREAGFTAQDIRDMIKDAETLRTTWGNFKAVKAEFEGYFERDDYGYDVEDMAAEFYKRLHAMFSPVYTDSMPFDEYRQSYHKPAYMDGVKFIHFMYDGTVDTECTMTVDIESDPKNILYIPLYAHLFNGLQDKTEGVQYNNAGYHISVLTSTDYPIQDREFMTRNQSHKNFKRTMTALLPALYTIGTTNASATRPISYRNPRVSEDKYSAIHRLGCGFEWRVFDVCYHSKETASLFADYFHAIVTATNKYFQPDDAVQPSKTLELARGKAYAFTIQRAGTENMSKHVPSIDTYKILRAGLHELRRESKSVTRLSHERRLVLTQRIITDAERKELKQLREQAENAALRAYVNDMAGNISRLIESTVHDGFRTPRERLDILTSDEYKQRLIEQLKKDEDAIKERAADSYEAEKRNRMSRYNIISVEA